MRKLKTALLCFALLLAGQSFAQTRVIRGTVRDSVGNPLANVSVQVQNTKIGTRTNDAGTFSMQVPSSASTLVISNVGFESQQVNISGSDNVSVTLRTGRQGTLQEVVVTALGIAKDRRSLGYATQTVRNDQIANKGETNLVNALQGKVAGVTITSASGSPGASANINIRGITSFQQSNQPLFVIDGIPVSNDVDRTNAGPISTLGDQQPPNRILDLNLNDVESVNILKGPGAAALYGSRASNGAIVITTKKGSSARGRVDVVVNSSYAWQQQNGLPKFQNTYGQGLNGVLNPISGNSFGPRFGATPSTINGLIDANGNTLPYTLYENNIRNFFETGTIADNNVNVSMGDATQNASISLGNLAQKGIMPNTSLNRTNVSFSAGMKINRFRISGSALYANTKQTGVLGGNSAGGGSGFAYLVNIPRSLDLQAFKDNYKNANGSQNFPLIANNIENPYFTAYENPVKSGLSRITGNISLGYDITDWLNIGYRLGIDAYTDRRKQIYVPFSRVVPAGLVLEDIFYRSELNGDLLINAKKKDILTDGLNASLLLGQNVNQRKFQNISAQGDVLTIPGFYNLSNATIFSNGTGETNNTRRLLGYYGQLSLDYNNYLFLEFTARVDQSSTLPKNNNTYLYPSVNASFVFTDALKLNSSVLSYGKIRASAAKVGRDAPPNILDNTYLTGPVGGFGNNVAGFNFPFTNGANTISGFALSTTIINKELKPEFTTSYEAGVNLGLFQNKVSIDFTYFNEVSTNQIMRVAVPTSTGFNTRYANVGSMYNKGIELMVNATPVSGPNFKWDVSANFTRIRNKVTEIFNDIQNFPISSGQSFTGVVPSIALNQPYGVIIGNKAQRAPDGQFLINPATGLFQPALAGQVIADPNPDFTAGITNNFRYKNFNLSFLWDLTYGGQIFSFTVPAMRSAGLLAETGVDREQPRVVPGVIEVSPGKYVPNNIQVPAQTYWRMGGLATYGETSVFDATVLKLRELSISYELPKSAIGNVFNGVRFSVFGRNLFYYAPNYPMDPEVNTQGAGNLRGLDLQGAPNVRTVGVGLRLAFK